MNNEHKDDSDMWQELRDKAWEDQVRREDKIWLQGIYIGCAVGFLITVGMGFIVAWLVGA